MRVLRDRVGRRPRLAVSVQALPRSSSNGTVGAMRLLVEFELEKDGRWIADVTDLPGVMAYGRTRDEALAAVKALALRVLAERIEHGELSADLPELTFGVQAA